MAKKAKINKLHTGGSFRPTSVNLEERTVEVSFTTGQGGLRYDWNSDTEFIEELDVTAASVRTERLDKGLSAIDSHNTYGGLDAVFGVTENYRFENGELIGTVRFASDEASDVIFQKVVDGILRHVSLGYKVYEYTAAPSGEDQTPVYRATDWEPTELSFVPVSFETTNGVRAERNDNLATFEVSIKEIKMTKEQRERLLALQGINSRSAEEETEMAGLLAIQTREDGAVPAATVPATPAATVPATPAAAPEQRAAAPAAPAAIPAGLQLNLGDLEGMRTAATTAGLSTDFALDAWKRGDSMETFYQSVIGEMGRQGGNAPIGNKANLNSDKRADAKEGQIRAAQSAIMIRGGMGALEGVSGEQSLRYQNQTLLDTARSFLEQSGVNTMGMSPMKVAERAFHSTSDFPMILANIMNTSVHSGYQEIPQTFRDLGVQSTAVDFRDKHTVGLGEMPGLLPLGENGEYKGATLSENGEKYRISTFARKIGFTRELLINDALNVLTNVPQMFGQAGSRLESDIVWGLLLGYDFLARKAKPVLMADGKNVYHADHNNLMTGVASAMSEEALDKLRLQGRNMKTRDGNFMPITYNNIVVPGELESVAEKLILTRINATKLEDVTTHTNKFGLRVEPRLAMASTFGTTGWLAFSNMLRSFEYSYLLGEEAMHVEQTTSTDSDGMVVKVRKDFGAGMIDARGTSKQTGKAA